MNQDVVCRIVDANFLVNQKNYGRPDSQCKRFLALPNLGCLKERRKRQPMSQRLPHPASPKYCQEALAQLAMAVNSQRNYLHFSTAGAVMSHRGGMPKWLCLTSCTSFAPSHSKIKNSQAQLVGFYLLTLALLIFSFGSCLAGPAQM